MTKKEWRKIYPPKQRFDAIIMLCEHHYKTGIRSNDDGILTQMEGHGTWWGAKRRYRKLRRIARKLNAIKR